VEGTADRASGAGYANATVSQLFERMTGLAAGVLDLSDRGLLHASGSDRVRFLNGMLSNDVGRLAMAHAMPALLLTRKGHVLSELQVLHLEGALLLDVSAGTAGAVREVLEKHVIADDVNIEDRSAALAQLAIEGPAARAALARLGVAAPERSRLSVDPDGAIWIGDGLLTPDGVRLIAPRERVERARADLELAPLTPEQISRLRIAYFVPEYGVDVTERHFPQEARLDAALSFTKGCYIGQEIVARIHSRGAVRKFLTQLEFDAHVSAAAELHAAGRRIGELTRSSALDGAPASIALGYVGREWLAPGTEVDAGGVRGRVTGPAL
jgi:folate-binding protein YgfZ